MTTSTAASTVRSEDRVVARLTLAADVGGDGPPVVVVHHSTGPLWTAFLDVLARDHEVVAPHLGGYGRSGRPEDARSPRDLAILCLQQLDALAIGSADLVGLGFGGWVAAEMATMNQGRFRSLSLVGAAGIRPPSDGLIHDPMMTSYEEYMRLGFSDQTRFEELFGTELAPELIELWDFSREMTARVTWKPWMWSGPLPQLLRGVTIPALVVWGDDDRVVPFECAQCYLDELASARLEVVAGSGHNVDLERPDVLARLITMFTADVRS